MHIVLIGLPGSGKGTQTKMIKSSFADRDVHIISTGDLLRLRSQGDDDLGEKIRDTINKGLLVDIDIVNNVISSAVKMNNDNNDIYIWDGYPRNWIQACNLLKILSNKNISTDKIIAFWINLDVNNAINRVLSRIQCNYCKSIFSNSEVNEDNCPKCGSVLYKRSDDNIEAVNKRIEVANLENLKVINFFELNEIKVYDIDGSLTKQEVFNSILNKCRAYIN